MLIGEVDVAMRNDIDGNPSHEAYTNPPFTKSCIVNNKTFAHSEMIPSDDRGSHCLCVAGEVYCWWQTYAGSLSTSVFGLKISKSSTAEPPTTLAKTYSTLVKELSENSEASEKWVYEASGEMQDEEESLKGKDIFKGSLMAISTNSTAITIPMTPAYSTRMPVTCLVMGRTYHQGEVLPHSTGNCVECSCGDEGRIECSPRDCVGLRLQNTGDDDFELFDVDHDRGNEGSF
ncbi:PREDICTED: uncharacterized protein LOC105362702 [Ceratosolen solmsi marchali]|uniref:Uncharacterized protein LOC105362702 n=1 Tax=Ceratosolen solmsi marchali TaxID=326594 RepID=A0AAJ6YI69_9HYME|nr:PREDICTED: uncharacterized protein LOC105362702 [Ceratosolen solmsi marchali]